MAQAKERYIVHIDMDAFFAAIEQRDNPSYKGKPVVVGADPKGGKGRGVVSTSSYEARKYGIHSAMPISTAFRKCPHAVFLPVDMEKYGRESAKIMRVLDEFSPALEQVSIDEAFLDVSGTYRLFGTARELCITMKKRILEETGLKASVGLAPTKMAAKIASGLLKPDGFVCVDAEGLLGFLSPLDVGSLWGVGEKTKEALNRIGIKTVGDLAARKREELTAMFGKNGGWLLDMARGIDESEVETETEVKSISNESTFQSDTADRGKIESELSWLCERVSDRLRQDGFMAGTVTLKIRFSDFTTKTKQTTAGEPVCLQHDLLRCILRLYEGFRQDRRKVRLVGVKASGLAPASSADLYAKRHDGIQSTIDGIRHKFGFDAILRARSKS